MSDLNVEAPLTTRRPADFDTSVAEAIRAPVLVRDRVALRQTKKRIFTFAGVDGPTCERAMRNVSEAHQMVKGLPKVIWASAPEPSESEHRLRLTPDAPPVDTVTRGDLLATIHEKIIPQLVLTHCELGKGGACPDARPPPTVEEVASFAAIAVREDDVAALAFVEVLASQGVSLEAVLLHLVAPAARLLGDQWLDDVRSFTEVTIGLGTLQRVVHVLGPSFAPDTANRGLVVLIAAPSEQHTLGIYMLGEFLRRAGWGVLVEPNMSEDELVSMVGSQRVELVGISMSSSHGTKALKRLVTLVRRASVNPDLTIMMGGSHELRDAAEQLGALYCSDPREAVCWLEQHVLTRRQNRPS
jgi:methanogenic corrinoid protein MtbC1